MTQENLTIEQKRAQLTSLKQQPISDFLPSLGWTKKVDEVATWHKSGQSIKVYISKSGQWMFKNFANGMTGSVIDLAQDVAGSMDAARRLLLSIAGSVIATSPSSSQNPSTHSSSSLVQSSEKEYLSPAEVLDRYKKASEFWDPALAPPAFMLRRRLAFIDAIHARTFRVSGTGSIRVPFFHVDEDGRSTLVGYESRRPDQPPMFEKGARVGVWISGLREAGDTIVVTEGMFDALAHDILRGSRVRRYLGVRSGAEQYAVHYIATEFKRGMIVRVNIATDNDSAGMLYAHKVMAGLKDQIASGLVVRYVPPGADAKDINDELIYKVEHGGDKGAEFFEMMITLQQAMSAKILEDRHFAEQASKDLTPA